MGAVTGGLAMLLIAQEGEVDGDAVIGDDDLAALLQDFHGELAAGAAVRRCQLEDRPGGGVEAGDGDVLQVNGGLAVVTPGGGEDRAGQIQLVADVVLGLIRAGDGQAGDGLLVADDGANIALLPVALAVLVLVQQVNDGAVLHLLDGAGLAEVGAVLAHRVVGTVVVRLGNAGVLPIRGILILAVDPVLDVRNGIAGGIVVEDVGFLIQAKLVGAGVDMLDAADGLRRAVCVVEVVVLNDVVTVQGTHVADDAALGAANVLFGGHRCW